MSKTDIYIFRCGVCCQSFPEQEQCYQHMIKHDRSSTLRSSISTSTLTPTLSKSPSASLLSHKGIKEPGIPETCTFTRNVPKKSSTNISNTEYLKNLNNKHSALVCPYCDRVLTKPSLLTVHLRTHTNERPYKCDLCSKAFKRKTHLTQHRQLHSGVKQYKCLKCNVAYADKCNLNRHNKLYHGKKNTIQQNFSSRRTKTVIVVGLASSVGCVKKTGPAHCMTDNGVKNVISTSSVSDDGDTKNSLCRCPVAKNTSLTTPTADELSESLGNVCAEDKTEPNDAAGHSDDETLNNCEIKNSFCNMATPACTELIKAPHSKVLSPTKTTMSVDERCKDIGVVGGTQNTLSKQKSAHILDLPASTEEIQFSRIPSPSNSPACVEHGDIHVCLEDESPDCGHKGLETSPTVDESQNSPDMIVCVIDETCVILDSSNDGFNTVITVETGSEPSQNCTDKEPLSDTDESTPTELKAGLDYDETDNPFVTPRTKDHVAEEIKFQQTFFKCDSCMKEFQSEKALKYHQKKHTNEGAIRCRICRKDFFKPSVFKVHMRSHTGERPHCCSFCPKSYRDLPQLRDHMKLHTGERLFPCSECNKVFVKQSGLDVHSRTHTGCKMFECEVCSKNFTTQQHLKRHRRSHTGEKPFSCSVCNLKFGDTSNRKKHMSRRHGDKT